jgi:hypothetical protein
LRTHQQSHRERVGEWYQFDWSHETITLQGLPLTVKAAHMKLSHSRMPFVRVYFRETQELVFDAHDKAFRFYVGACRRGIYDNMKTAVEAISRSDVFAPRQFQRIFSWNWGCHQAKRLRILIPPQRFYPGPFRFNASYPRFRSVHGLGIRGRGNRLIDHQPATISKVCGVAVAREHRLRPRCRSAARQTVILFLRNCTF